MPSPSASNIYFFFEKKISLRQRLLLKRFIKSIFKKEKCRLGSLNYIFCDDQRLLEINRQYLKHDYYTDIITFQFNAKNEPIEGEVYISIDRVRENAKTLGVSLTSELNRVIFHGALHLCGYPDNTASAKKRMRAKEDYYISRYVSREKN